MENLDLDINNYSIKDIENFFRLKPNSKYSAADIEEKEYQIREQLLNSGHINKRFKRDLIEFLTLAKQWLRYVKCDNTKNQPTTIPKNYKLDNIDTPLSKEIIPRNEEIINKPETQFIYANNSDFFPGTLNQLNTRIITKCINIDSRFRENLSSTQSSDFTIQMPIKFSKVVSMQLSALEFPVSFYGISSYYGNNFLYLKVNYNSFDTSGLILESEKIITIPDGNYNALDFIETINNLLCPKNPDTTIKFPNDIFSYIQMSLNITPSGSGTGKVTIAPDGSRANFINTILMDFTMDINGQKDSIDISNKLGWNLGFIKSKYKGSKTYTADTVIEPANIRYIYLAIDDFNNSSNNHFINVFKNSIMSPDILARISIRGSYFTLIMESDFNIVTEPRRYFGPVDIQRLRIRIFDDKGRILPMNNSNFSFCLNLKMLYDL